MWRREHGNKEQKELLDEWSIDIPRDYIDLVNVSQINEKGKRELESLIYSVNKGKPYGSKSWTDKMINRFNLGSTLRRPGRPKKGS